MAARPALVDNPPLFLRGLITNTYANAGLPEQTLTTVALIVTAFIVGECMDAIRNISEHLWDRFQTVNWSVFTTADKEKVEQFKGSHFTYYVFDCNICMALLVLTFLAYPTRWMLLTLALALIFTLDGIGLRKEIAVLTHRDLSPPLP